MKWGATRLMSSGLFAIQGKQADSVWSASTAPVRIARSVSVGTPVLLK